MAAYFVECSTRHVSSLLCGCVDVLYCNVDIPNPWTLERVASNVFYLFFLSFVFILRRVSYQMHRLRCLQISQRCSRFHANDSSCVYSRGAVRIYCFCSPSFLARLAVQVVCTYFLLVIPSNVFMQCITTMARRISPLLILHLDWEYVSFETYDVYYERLSPGLPTFNLTNALLYVTKLTVARITQLALHFLVSYGIP